MLKQNEETKTSRRIDEELVSLKAMENDLFSFEKSLKDEEQKILLIKKSFELEKVEFKQEKLKFVKEKESFFEMKIQFERDLQNRIDSLEEENSNSSLLDVVETFTFAASMFL